MTFHFYFILCEFYVFFSFSLVFPKGETHKEKTLYFHCVSVRFVTTFQFQSQKKKKNNDRNKDRHSVDKKTNST